MSSVSIPRESALRPISGGSQQDSFATKPLPKAASAEPDVHYTCFIRLPFPRGDFVDPPQAEWSSTKDRALWKIISKASNSKELDWEDMSARFDVSLPFLLQQAAWLYERHFAQMKAQMKKLSPSTAPSPIPPESASNSSTPITGTFATGSLGPRATSALSARARDSPTPTTGSGNSGMIKTAGTSSVLAADAPSATYTASGPPRTLSTRTVTQSRAGTATSPNPQNRNSFRSSFGSQRKARPDAAQDDAAGYESPPPADPSESDLSSDEDVPSQSMARSQAFRRPTHRRGAKKGGGLLSYDEADDDDDEDNESSGGFLPFAAVNASKNEDIAATLRSPPPKRTTATQRPTIIESSTSSGSSAAAPTRQHQMDPASALSPRQRAVLSPRSKGSEGAPSMGSSFSDLDDASISQSALEDAYLSNMQRGTASRMSTISQALKSKYL